MAPVAELGPLAGLEAPSDPLSGEPFSGDAFAAHDEALAAHEGALAAHEAARAAHEAAFGEGAFPAAPPDPGPVLVAGPALGGGGEAPVFFWMGVVWLAGVVVVGGYFAAGVVRLWGWTQDAAEVRDEALLATLRDVAWELDIARPVRLLVTEHAVTPLTWGVLRPVVLLPAEALAWTEERMRIVLLHELAHVARLDALSQSGAQAACALLWFHPLAWMAARRMRVEREHACDDLVLARGARASTYAGHLLELARNLRGRVAIPEAAVAMARRSELEGRLLSILETDMPREILTRARTALAALGVALAILPLGAFKPWGHAPALAGAVSAEHAIVLPHPPAPPAAPTPPAAPAPPDAPLAPTAPLAPAFAAAVAPGADDERSWSFNVRPGGTLDVQTDVGSVEVEPGAGNRVEVRVEHNLGERFRPDARQSGDRITVTGAYERERTGWMRNQRVRFVVRVPARYNVDVNTRGGSISVGALEGRVETNTSGGSLAFGRIDGDVKGNTSGGSIQLAGATGDARLETSGGSVTAGEVGGSLYISTSGGSIRVASAGEGLTARTSGGSISANLARQPKGDVVLSTSGGSVSVGLPDGANFDLDASASAGRVRSDFHPEHDRARRGYGSDALRARIGRGGPALRVSTSAGNVTIERGRARTSSIRTRVHEGGPGAFAYSYHTGAALTDADRAALRESMAEARVSVREALAGARFVMNDSLRVAIERGLAEARVALSEQDLAQIQRDLALAQREMHAERALDDDEIRRSVQEALREAQEAIREAEADVREAEREAAQEFREAEREREQGLRDAERFRREQNDAAYRNGADAERRRALDRARRAQKARANGER